MSHFRVLLFIIYLFMDFHFVILAWFFFFFRLNLNKLPVPNAPCSPCISIVPLHVPSLSPSPSFSFDISFFDEAKLPITFPDFIYIASAKLVGTPCSGHVQFHSFSTCPLCHSHCHDHRHQTHLFLCCTNRRQSFRQSVSLVTVSWSCRASTPMAFRPSPRVTSLLVYYTIFPCFFNFLFPIVFSRLAHFQLFIGPSIPPTPHFSVHLSVEPQSPRATTAVGKMAHTVCSFYVSCVFTIVRFYPLKKLNILKAGFFKELRVGIKKKISLPEIKPR